MRSSSNFNRLDRNFLWSTKEMSSITIITCFTYPDNRKFVFNPDHLRSDLRRVLTFSHNQIGSSLKEIYVLTDILPDERICNGIISDFQEEVMSSLRKRDLNIDIQTLNRSQIHRRRPLEWLNYLLKNSSLAETIATEILPILNKESSIEFASLFTNFAVISGKQEYEDCLVKIFQRPMKNLFFYYSGHGVRLIDVHNHELCLVIPLQSGQTHYYSRKSLQKCFQRYLEGTDMVVIFDCCYGEEFLEQPHKIGFLPGDNLREKGMSASYTSNHILCLSGTRSNQTCGFYSDPRESSSLFTYYLFQHLNRISEEIRSGRDSRELSRLDSEVEKKIQEYRERTGKQPQNMVMSISHPEINRFPKWFFKNSFKKQKPFLVEEI